MQSKHGVRRPSSALRATGQPPHPNTPIQLNLFTLNISSRARQVRTRHAFSRCIPFTVADTTSIFRNENTLRRRPLEPQGTHALSAFLNRSCIRPRETRTRNNRFLKQLQKHLSLDHTTILQTSCCRSRARPQSGSRRTRSRLFAISTAIGKASAVADSPEPPMAAKQSLMVESSPQKAARP